MNSITVKQKNEICLPAMAGLLVAAMALFCFTGGARATEMPQKPQVALPAQVMGASEASGQEKFLQGNIGTDGQPIVEARRGRGSSASSGRGRGRGRGGDSGRSGGSSSSSSSSRSSSRSSDDGSHREDSGLHHRSDSQERRSLQEDRLDRLGDDSAVRGGSRR